VCVCVCVCEIMFFKIAVRVNNNFIVCRLAPQIAKDSTPPCRVARMEAPAIPIDRFVLRRTWISYSPARSFIFRAGGRCALSQLPRRPFMDKHRTALVLFAIALGVVIAVAFVTTVDRVNVHRASNDAPPGTTGLAKPHPQLDRAPGDPIVRDR
jgi:hypothetical protein